MRGTVYLAKDNPPQGGLLKWRSQWRQNDAWLSDVLLDQRISPCEWTSEPRRYAPKPASNEPLTP
jgi:hypothetical protein